MTYTVSLNNSQKWTVVAPDEGAALKKAVEAADFVDAWEWAEGEITVKPFYGLYYDYDNYSVYDNGSLAIADWTKLGAWASMDGFRPSCKSVRGVNGFLYRVSFFHDGTFMCVERD
jgi:hypothetical protein